MRAMTETETGSMKTAAIETEAGIMMLETTCETVMQKGTDTESMMTETRRGIETGTGGTEIEMIETDMRAHLKEVEEMKIVMKRKVEGMEIGIEAGTVVEKEVGIEMAIGEENERGVETEAAREIGVETDDLNEGGLAVAAGLKIAGIEGERGEVEVEVAEVEVGIDEAEVGTGGVGAGIGEVAVGTEIGGVEVETEEVGGEAGAEIEIEGVKVENEGVEVEKGIDLGEVPHVAGIKDPEVEIGRGGKGTEEAAKKKLPRFLLWRNLKKS